MVASIMVQVAYRRDDADDESLVMMLEDVALLIYALTAAPAWWGGSSVSSVWQSEAATVEAVDDPNGRPATRVISIPLDVQYIEDGGSVSGLPPIVPVVMPEHNLLSGIQGGVLAERHHLTAAAAGALDPAVGWDDLVTPATAVNPPGGVAAAVQNITELTLDFDAAADRRIDVEYQMPHRWAAGTEVRFHLHTMRSVAPGAGEAARWSVRWRTLSEGGVVSAWATDFVTTPIPPGTGPRVIGIKAFAMAGLTISDCLQIQLTRTATHVDDTYGGTLMVYNLDLHYQTARAMGSANEYSL
jgi:hypothetical protein